MTASPRTWLAGPDEAEAVSRLLGAFKDHLCETEGRPAERFPSDAQRLQTVREILARPDAEYLLAAVDGGAPAAAVCQLRFRPSVWTAAPDCWLEDLYVEAAARGAGLGRALVDAAEARARARGVVRLQLDVAETNVEALALYRSSGFEIPDSGARSVLATLRLSPSSGRTAGRQPSG